MCLKWLKNWIYSLLVLEILAPFSVGYIGKSFSILVWQSEMCMTDNNFTGFLRVGVELGDFSYMTYFDNKKILNIYLYYTYSPFLPSVKPWVIFYPQSFYVRSHSTFGNFLPSVILLSVIFHLWSFYSTLVILPLVILPSVILLPLQSFYCRRSTVRSVTVSFLPPLATSGSPFMWHTTCVILRGTPRCIA